MFEAHHRREDGTAVARDRHPIRARPHRTPHFAGRISAHEALVMPGLLARPKAGQPVPLVKSHSTAGRWGDALSQKFLYVITDPDEFGGGALPKVESGFLQRSVRSNRDRVHGSLQGGWVMSPRTLPSRRCIPPMPGARHYDLRPVRNHPTVTRCSCSTGSGDVERYACRFGNLHSPRSDAAARTVLGAVWAWAACRGHRPRPGHVKSRCACRCRSPARREDVPTC